jgi:predicted DCC family thiol-disulfide oxidoreductase YuxK
MPGATLQDPMPPTPHPCPGIFLPRRQDAAFGRPEWLFASIRNSIGGMENLPKDPKGDVWFVYDGDCPLCTVASHALRIRAAVGALNLVDARAEKDHPVVREVNARKLDLDEGMVIKFGDAYYHGGEALHVMAMLGTGQGWFNRLNALMFRSRLLSRICYPPMRAVRNLLIRMNGVGKIDNLRGDR